MSDENKNLEVQENEKKCILKSREFKKFLIVTFGSFLGVFFGIKPFYRYS